MRGERGTANSTDKWRGLVHHEVREGGTGDKRLTQPWMHTQKGMFVYLRRERDKVRIEQE